MVKLTLPPPSFKWWCTMTVAITCFAVALNSAVITADLAGVSETFGVSEEVSLLPITVFVVGFGIGPMAFAPLSEICGRRPIYASTLLIAVIFIIPAPWRRTSPPSSSAAPSMALPSRPR